MSAAVFLSVGLISDRAIVSILHEGNRLVILLGGGTKKRQQRDIQVAKELWQEYKRRKKEQ